MQTKTYFDTLSDSMLSGTSGSRRILFLSADHTGQGHRSISEALCQKILEKSPNSEVTIVDGFALGGTLMKEFSRLHNPFVFYFPHFWGFCYRMTNPMKSIINWVVKSFIGVNLCKKIEEVKPDVIVSVHAAFVTPVIDILKRKSLDIPVITFVADLDNITDLWVDSRAVKILCPSSESFSQMRSKLVPEERLMQVGFPVRAEFCCGQDNKQNHTADSGTLPATSVSEPEEPEPSILVVSGSQGSKFFKKIIRELLDQLPCRITIITGKNKKLKAYLEENLKDFGSRVKVLGFTAEIHKYMQEADLLIMRASPNMLMEAISLARPLVVMGAVFGQEKKNPDYVVRYGLGVSCLAKDSLAAKIGELLENECEGLRTIRQNQLQFRNLNAAADIAKFILDV